jgi:hypothetical protein
MTPALRRVMTAAAQHPDGFGRWATPGAPLAVTTLNKTIRAGFIAWSADDGRYRLTELGAQLCARAGIPVEQGEPAR